jgi:PBP1b-binding outer membrane lipoprotein LpoB
MKNNLVILFFLLVGCSEKKSKESFPVEKVDDLSQLIAEGITNQDFF